MSALRKRALRHWRRLAVPIVGLAAVVGMVLVVSAATSDKGQSPADAYEPRGAVTDAPVNPWAANDPALLSGAAVTPSPGTGAGVNPWAANDAALLASLAVDSPAGVVSEYGKDEIEWTQTGIGSVITQEDGSMFAVASVENSVDGPGAVVSEITLEGSGGTQSARRYNANGVFVGEEEFTLGTANADGTIPFEGSGKCVKGGTGAHKKEKCSYTLSGTLDPTTNVVTFEVTGTSTR